MPTRSNFQLSLRTAALTGFAGAFALGLGGCHSDNPGTQSPATVVIDPATANEAPVYTGAPAGSNAPQAQTAQVMGRRQAFAPQTSAEAYNTQSGAAPIVRRAGDPPPAAQSTQGDPVPQASGAQEGAAYGAGQNAPGGYGDAENDPGYQGYDDGDPASAGQQAIAEADTPPPPQPYYDQPPAPADNYIWTPGYWDYARAGYFWVPGAWVAPPFIGALWTPPYWGFSRGRYLCHRGYWGQHIGYYGGVNYGFGYVGTGYYGGYWNHRNFVYNRAVTNVNITNVHNVYNRTVIVNNITYGPHTVNRVSYNGGRGGINFAPLPQEVAAMREAHFAPLPAQHENRVAASANRAQFFAANHGTPAAPYAARPAGDVHTIPMVPVQHAFNRGAGVPMPPSTTMQRPGASPIAVPRPGNPPAAMNRPANQLGNQPSAPANAMRHPNQTPQPGNHPGATNSWTNRPNRGTGAAPGPAPGVPSRPAASSDHVDRHADAPNRTDRYNRADPANPAGRPSSAGQPATPAYNGGGNSTRGTYPPQPTFHHEPQASRMGNGQPSGVAHPAPSPAPGPAASSEQRPQASQRPPEINQPRPETARPQPRFTQPRPEIARPQPQFTQPRPETARPQPPSSQPRSQVNQAHPTMQRGPR